MITDLATEPWTGTHRWRLRKWLPDRYGQSCRVLARGNGRGPRNVLVEFEDGAKVVAARYSIRKAR